MSLIKCIKNIFKKLFKKNDIVLGNNLGYNNEEIHIDKLTGEVLIKGKIIETYPVEYWFPEDLNENENKSK